MRACVRVLVALSCVCAWTPLQPSGDALAAAECLSHSEARTLWPRDHLRWHGASHCWDNRRKGDNRRDYQQETDPEAIPAAKPWPGSDTELLETIWPTMTPK